MLLLNDIKSRSEVCRRCLAFCMRVCDRSRMSVGLGSHWSCIGLLITGCNSVGSLIPPCDRSALHSPCCCRLYVTEWSKKTGGLKKIQPIKFMDWILKKCYKVIKTRWSIKVYSLHCCLWLTSLFVLCIIYTMQRTKLKGVSFYTTLYFREADKRFKLTVDSESWEINVRRPVCIVLSTCIIQRWCFFRTHLLYRFYIWRVLLKRG